MCERPMVDGNFEIITNTAQITKLLSLRLNLPIKIHHCKPTTTTTNNLLQHVVLYSPSSNS